MAAQTNMLISVGDRLRTGGESRATLRFPDLSVVRLDELTVIQIQPPSTNKLEWFGALETECAPYSPPGNNQPFRC